MIKHADLAMMLRRNPGPIAAHPPPMNPHQLQAQHQAELQKRELLKRQSRKPTDKNLPDGVEDMVIGDGVAQYKALRDVERKIDAATMRKRLDINDFMSRNLTCYKTMRIWISNTAENQPWQQGTMDADAFDFNTENQATYRVTISARLLDDEHDAEAKKDGSAGEQKDPDAMEEDNNEANNKGPQKKHAAQRTKFSHFFKQVTIDYDRSPALQPDGFSHIEWKKPESNAAAGANSDFDLLVFERKADENINVTINLYRDEVPERFLLSRPLAELLGTEEEDRGGVLMGIWTYVKANNLQSEEDSRKIRCDAELKAIFNNRDFVMFPDIPRDILPHLSPLPPYQLPYTIRVDKAYINPTAPGKPSAPTVYDVLVPLEDPLRTAMSDLTSPMSTLNQISQLDDQLAHLVQALHHSKAKHAFFTSFAADPVAFVKRWTSSQQRDLEVILGEATRGGGEDIAADEWRRGGKDGVWGSDKANEGVGIWLAKNKH
ncbi:SWI-SNF complex subunit [Phyllosticta citrichinensis]|uniref:SWI-SNF complex subunit n=1 Tax=Phyllosticta citrichinensis TaxID=1130410 RepID=A0ABR1Y4W1_9PEZI